ncbi:PREDICTED: uncharacterized protein LOC108800384, partial [Nanorana parkeri]|uniref:uncharacterized protein LOC108800384 n=1 Tax=Nanorana parkeri TaxID=125878 RepID=UPI00085448AE
SGTRTWNRVTSSICDQREERLALYRLLASTEMKALVTLLLPGWLGLAWCCNPQSGAANIARSGEATQSSTLIYYDISTVASNAIDGGKDQNWWHGSCTATDNEWESWWRLDLKQKHKVNMVVVYGRSDGYLERMKGLELRVGDSPNNHNPVCGTITNYKNATTTFCCNGMDGRYISAVIPGRSEYLTLCDVEVYACTVDGEAVSSPAECAPGTDGQHILLCEDPLLLAPPHGRRDEEEDPEERKDILAVIVVVYPPVHPPWIYSKSLLTICSSTEKESMMLFTNPQAVNERVTDIAWFLMGSQWLRNKNVEASEQQHLRSKGRVTLYRLLASIEAWRRSSPRSSSGGGLALAAQGTSFATPAALRQAGATSAARLKTDSQARSRMMKALVTLLLLGWLGLAGCCSPEPGAANIARSGEATQSSTYIYTNKSTVASNAIDGGTDQNWFHGSCTHTNNDMAPWWRLDLKQKYKVNIVVVYGRSDCCWYRMKGLELRVGDSPNNDNPVCGTITNSNITTTTFCCDGMEGRYISAVIPGRSELLHLCEVEVYGEPNIARSGVATQSSYYISTISSVASNAIDGGTDQNWWNGFCTTTDDEWESWWRLDLQQKYKVNMVVVYGRSDCCKERMNGLEVRVGDSPNNHNPVCGTITDSNNITTAFYCNGMEGRYISAVIPARSEYLTLCEVEVYGELAPEEYDVC